MKWARSHTRGFLLVEVSLAAAVFSLFVMAFVGASLYGEEATLLAGKRARATLLAQEGIEAVRNIRDESFSNLVDGSYGLVGAGEQWGFSGTEDVTEIFTRSIEIASLDENRKSVVSRVMWQQNFGREGEVALESRFTFWQRSSATSTE